MNRLSSHSYQEIGSVPHSRGDEPLMGMGRNPRAVAFPTAVGMNLGEPFFDGYKVRVPHSRGDEPRILALTRIRGERSPQPWG